MELWYRCMHAGTKTGGNIELRPGLGEGLCFLCRPFGRGLDRAEPVASSEARYKHREVEFGQAPKGNPYQKR